MMHSTRGMHPTARRAFLYQRKGGQTSALVQRHVGINAAALGNDDFGVEEGHIL
jgi:hypothetical protein